MILNYFTCNHCRKKKKIKDMAKYRRSKKHYCSRECSGKGSIGRKLTPEHRDKVVAALRRGSGMKGKIPWNKGIKFPEKSGKNCHLWKGGITKLGIQIRNCPEYSVWRKACLKRDDYTCLECDKRGGNLNVDHRKSFVSLIRRNKIKTLQQAQSCRDFWDISNGRTLCIKCHASTKSFPDNLKRYAKMDSNYFIKNEIEAECLTCNNKFMTREYLLSIGKGKYCSHECYWKAKVKKAN